MTSSASNISVTEQQNPFAKYVDLGAPTTGAGIFVRIGLPILAIPVLIYLCVSYNYYQSHARKPSFLGYLKFVFTCFGRMSKEIMKDVPDKRHSVYPTRWSTMPIQVTDESQRLQDIEKYSERRDKWDHEAQSGRTEYFKDEFEAIQAELDKTEYREDIDRTSKRYSNRPMASPLRTETMEWNSEVLPLKSTGKRSTVSLALPAADFDVTRPRHTFSGHYTLQKPQRSSMNPVSRRSNRVSQSQTSL